MPLPSVAIHGARQCKAITKRTKSRCLNPAAYGCLTCRYHGANPPHVRKNLSGKDHPQFIHGRFTKESKERNRQAIIKLRLLEDLGLLIGLFAQNTPRTRGRKPNRYQEVNLNDPADLILAISRCGDPSPKS